MKRKLLSLLLALTMVLSLLPATVLAASAVTDAAGLRTAISQARGVAEITLTDTIDVSDSDLLITNNADNEDSDTQPGTLTSLTIDLGGNTLDLGGGSINVTGVTLRVKNGTIKNSGDQPIVVRSTTSTALVTVENAVLSGKHPGDVTSASGNTLFTLDGCYYMAVPVTADMEAVVARASGGAPETGKLQDIINNTNGSGTPLVDGDAVWLLKDLTGKSGVEGDITIGANITLELGGHTVMFAQYKKQADMSTTSSLEIGSLIIGPTNLSTGKVSINNGTIMQEWNVSDSKQPAINISAGTVAINNTIVTGNDNGIEVSGAELTVSGARTEITGKRSNGVQVTGGNLIVEDGTITGIAGNGVQVTGGNLTVKGGTITGTGSNASDMPPAVGSGIDFAGTSTSPSIDNLIVEGGTITGIENGILFNGGTLEISGGTIQSTGKVASNGVEGMGIHVATATERHVNISDGDISGPTALYIDFDSSLDIMVRGGIFKSTVENGKSVDGSGSFGYLPQNGFISGGTFLNTSSNEKGVKDPLFEGYLHLDEYFRPDVIQRETGKVELADAREKIIIVTFYAGTGGMSGTTGGTFVVGGYTGSDIKVRVIEGGTLSESDLPVMPTCPGYAFDGWYTGNNYEYDDDEPFVFGEPITEEGVEVHAHWRPMVNITFLPGTGELAEGEETAQIEIGGKLSSLPVPTLPKGYNYNYTFGGWFCDKNYPEQPGWYHPGEQGNEIKITEETVFPIGYDKDTTYHYAIPQYLHAHWGYKITFNPNGGILDAGDDTRITGNIDAYGGTLSDFPTPTRTGYKFAGWYTDPDEEKGIWVDETGEYQFREPVTVYAHWTLRSTEDIDLKITGSDPLPHYLPAKDSSDPDPVEYKIILTATGKAAKFVENIADPVKANKFFTLTFDDGSGKPQEWPFTVERDNDNDTQVTITLTNTPDTAGKLFLTVKDDAFETAPKENHFSYEIPVVYTVTYDPNGGMWDETDGPNASRRSEIKNDGTAAFNPGPPTHPDDYVFLGWYTEEINGEEVDPENDTFERSTTIYAHWGYRITFYSKEVTPGDEDDEDDQEKYMYIETNTGVIGEEVPEEGILKEWPADPLNPGYTLDYWYYTDSDTGIETRIEKEQDGTFSPHSFKDNTEVYAKWKRTVTVIFDANGGTFDKTADKPTYEVIVNIDEEGTGEGTFPKEQMPGYPTRYNYTIVDGWWYTRNENEDSEEYKVDFDQPIQGVDPNGSMVYEKTVYAHWTANPLGKYTITFDANGGLFSGKSPEGITVSSDRRTAKGETDATGKLAELPTAELAGYEFLGWYMKTATGEVEAPFAEGFRNDTTVYAHWGIKITFDPTGGSFGETEETGENGCATRTTDENFKLTAPPPVPTRAGYNFKGWYTEKDGKGTPVTEEYPFGSGKATTVYAHWEKKEEYTITFDLNYEGAPAATTTTTVDGKLAELPAPTREGWNFVGWFTDKESGTQVEANKTVFTTNTTIYAHWTEQKEYTITFKLNYEGAPADTTATTGLDGKLATLPTDPTRDGYDFKEWNTKQDGTGDKVTTGYVFTADTTVYAQWTKNKEDDPSKPDDPGKPGPDDPSKPDEPTTKQYTITFDPNGGKLDDSDRKATTSTDGTLSGLPTPSRVGYIFEGWYTSRNSGVRISTSYKFTANTTVYARYSSIPYMNIPSEPQQSQSQAPAQGSLPASAFTPVTWRPAAVMQDVPASSWAYSAAQWAYQNGYLDTAADGTFRLNESVSHLQMWRIMAQWLGQPSLDEGSVNQWARQSGAAKVGSPSGTMTRQNMVEYLYQCYFLMGGNVSATGNLVQYRDGQQVTSTSAKNAWSWAVDKGIISGTTDGYLNPNKTLTRAEFATILMKMCQIR